MVFYNHMAALLAPEWAARGTQNGNPKMAGDFTVFLAQFSGFQQATVDPVQVDYRNLSIDSRTLDNGQLFVAIRGDNFDGHQFVAAALEKGASAAVVEKGWFREHEGSLAPDARRLVVVNDTLAFLQQLAAWHRRQFSYPVIGLSGSNGKTTTREMIAQIFARDRQVLQSKGNLNNHIGLPLTLLKMDGNFEIAVVEMGTNHPGEIAHLASLAAPDAAVLTNIGKGHIGFFGTLKAIYEEKTALFQAVEARGLCFINMDDPLLSQYPEGGARVTVGQDPRNDFFGRVESVDPLGRITMVMMDQIRVKLNIPGRHNFHNALLAAAVARQFGVEWADIQAALEEFKPANQRMNVWQAGGVLFVNDAYNANPDSMRAAVDYLESLPGNIRHRYLVIGDMLELEELGPDEHRALGTYIATTGVDAVYLFGPLSRHTLAALQNGPVKAQWFDNHAALAEALRGHLSADSAVLVKGSRGMRMETVFKELGIDPPQN